MTFMPESSEKTLEAIFEEFAVESGYDYLYIYNGSSTNAPQIGQYTGNQSPGTVTASNTEGALTFRFTSDYAVNEPGWKAVVRCVGDTGLFEESDVPIVYPNPNNGTFTINANGAIDYQLFNNIGQLILSGQANGTTQINAQGLSQGVYFLQLKGENESRIEKLIIEK